MPIKRFRKRQFNRKEREDILFNLACLANSLDIDLGDCLNQTIDKIEKRDQNRFEKKDTD